MRAWAGSATLVCAIGVRVNLVPCQGEKLSQGAGEAHYVYQCRHFALLDWHVYLHHRELSDVPHLLTSLCAAASITVAALGLIATLSGSHFWLLRSFRHRVFPPSRASA